MNKRNEIINYLLDFGLDVDTQNNEVRGYFDEKHILSIGDWSKYQIEIFDGFEECFGNKASEVFMKIAEYCCIDPEERRK